jgi:hypothetical protein
MSAHFDPLCGVARNEMARTELKKAFLRGFIDSEEVFNNSLATMPPRLWATIISGFSPMPLP